jgi:hypothetical protein
MIEPRTFGAAFAAYYAARAKTLIKPMPIWSVNAYSGVMVRPGRCMHWRWTEEGLQFEVWP